MLIVVTHVTQAITIDTPADGVWRLIRDFNTGSKYLAMVVQCTVQNEDNRLFRTLTYIDGSIIIERLETVDEVAHRLSYTLLTDTPFGSCLMTMVLRALSHNQTELIWSASFQPAGLPEAETISLLEGMLADNCHLLKRLCEQ